MKPGYPDGVRRFVFKPRWIVGHVLVVAAALTCIRLADWQLSRAHVTEALQNWGYAFQWPLFSVFFLIGWWRMLRLESIRLDELEAAEASGSDGADAPAPVAKEAPLAEDGPLSKDAPVAKDGPRAQGTGRRGARERPPLTAPILAPTAPAPGAGAPAERTVTEPEDEQLAAYNRMLAKLASQDAARDEAGRR